MNKKMSILMFSGDYDKALAALILANTAKEINVDALDSDIQLFI